MRNFITKSMVAVVAVLGFALSGCSGADDNAGSENLTNFGWVSFEVPQGWEDAKESDSYISIRNENGNAIKIFQREFPTDGSRAAAIAADEIERNADSYADGGTKKIGNYEWSLVTFEFNGKPSFKAFADADKNTVIEATVFEREVDDPDVQTVLSTMKATSEPAGE